MDMILIALVFTGLAVLQSLLITRFALKGFGYRRQFDRLDAAVGDRIAFVEVIRNRSLLFLPWVRMEMRIPPELEFRSREEVETRGEIYQKSVFTLSPFSQVTRRHQVIARQRGHFNIRQVSMTAGDLLGFRLIARDLPAPAELYIAPALLPEADLPLPSSKPQGDLSVRRWIQPDPFLVNGIRGYRPGDAVRDIHWAATARTGEIQVKTHDYTADPRLMVLINGQTSAEQWDDLMEYEQSQVEYAISLAATLCLRALSGGCEAGFAANMPLDEETESACLLPQRGAGRDRELLRAFASLRVRRVCTYPTFLSQLPPLSGVDYVLISAYDSPAIRQQMEELRLLGNTVTLHILPGEARHG